MMSLSWQDWVIGVGQFVFAIALVPSIRGAEKPARSTCALTAMLLFTFAVTYMTLHLMLAALSVTICGAGWMILLMQKRYPLLREPVNIIYQPVIYIGRSMTKENIDSVMREVARKVKQGDPLRRIIL